MARLKKKIRAKVINGSEIFGEIVFSEMPITFLGGVDPKKGVVCEKNHVLYGKTIKNKILVFPHGKGSTVGSYVIYQMKKLKTAPKAFIVEKADEMVLSGALISDIPMFVVESIEELREAKIAKIRGEEIELYG